MPGESLIAVFIDFENLAIGAQVTESGRFQIELVLKRLLEKGRIVYKRAYCDWSRYPSAVREFHGQGIGLVDIPQSRMSGKNSADIHMVVDALDLCYSKSHIDTFALLSGDSDFSPLVSKLKENDKRVIGVGVKKSTSDLLIAGCDEFIYYDDLVRAAKPKRPRGPLVARSPSPRRTRLWTYSWRSSSRWSGTTTPSGARWSSKRCDACIQGSTKATTATGVSRI